MAYLWCLVQAGQIVKEYFVTWVNQQLVAHVGQTGPGAVGLRYHSKYGKEELKKVSDLFGQPPCWSIIDDEIPKRRPTWKGAPSLYLFTAALAKDSCVCRGDGKRPIPIYLLPLKDDIKEDLGRWERDYLAHDELWLSSGALEIPVYRQMAEPTSQLAQLGRGLCQQLEQATGLPTYYYLIRFWGRSKGEEHRSCPGCNRDWSRPHPSGRPFHEFDFRCEPCRLVSHIGSVSHGARYARIGEFKPSNKANDSGAL